MRRHLECSMGTLSLDRDSMGVVRKAQNRYHQKGESVEEISQALGISFPAAARAIAYPTHFFSVDDLQDPEEDGDILERLTPGWLAGSPEETVIRSLTMECLREEFLQLAKKDQEILGRCFGVYGYPKSDLREIAMRNRMKESGVEKAKEQAIKRLRDRCQNSLAWKLRRARRMIDLAVPMVSESRAHSIGWVKK